MSLSNPNIEVVDDQSFVPKVVVSDVVKQYKKTSTYPPAVNHLTLTLYESQISCLLGHNGAGKSTTVSVMTGLFPPTSGDVFIYGHSIVNDMKGARQSIGICPQHNILFNSLTVSEHLRFFMRIKGMTPDRTTVERHAEEIGLTDFLNTRSVALSGGNKRKLSVSIALCADPRFLLLDEPTSAVDPASRRAIWELLRQKRKGRVTLLTTHFMDEAELLADRVAVLKAGKLQCVGSPVFLKERFGLGYNLTIVIEPVPGKEGHSTFASQLQNLTEFVQTVIPGIEQVRVSGKEATYRIPRGSENVLPKMFDAIEQEKVELGIGAFGIQDSSLEEVFLQLAEDEDDGEDGGGEINDSHPVTPSTETADVEASPSKTPGKMTEVLESSDEDKSAHSLDSNEKSNNDESLSYHQLSPLKQIGLLYWKRFVVQKRDGKGFFFSILIPVLVIALVLLVLMIDPPFVGPAIEVSPELYNEVVGEASDTGVTIGAPSSAEYEWLSSGLSKIHPFMKFTLIENATSTNVSELLLETINDKNGPPRFGAYVLDDGIDVNIQVNWDTISEYTEEFLPVPLTSLIKILNDPASLSNFTPTSTSEVIELLQSDGCQTDLLEQLDSTFLSVIISSSTENLEGSGNDLLDAFILTGATNDIFSFPSTDPNVVAFVSGVCNIVADIQDRFSNASAAFPLLSDLEELLATIPTIPEIPDGTERFQTVIQTSASVIHNSSSPHAVAAFNQAYTNILYRSNNCTNNSPGRLVSVNEPLPLT
jgi:ABC-type multidrug transport system ATPase subunit